MGATHPISKPLPLTTLCYFLVSMEDVWLLCTSVVVVVVVVDLLKRITNEELSLLFHLFPLSNLK